jgi:hypothetical protein
MKKLGLRLTEVLMMCATLLAVAGANSAAAAWLGYRWLSLTVPATIVVGGFALIAVVFNRLSD